MRIKAVIFDLDGTLTQPYFDFDAIRREMGYPPEAEPILELMEKMTIEEREKAERILRFHEEKAVTESILNPGTRETLAELQKRGIPVGILTRNKRENAIAVFEKHGLNFDAIVGRQEGPVKPDPFGVLSLCQKFAVLPQESLVIGDYLFDLLCARAANAVAVLLKNNIKAGEFEKHADFVINNLEEIFKIIDHN